MVILYHRPGSRWVFAFLQGLRLNVKSLPSKVDCVTCQAKAGQCVPKPLLVSGMSNLISCHKYFIWREKKKTFQICPVQTQCRPFQHSSAVMGKQPCSPRGPILGGHGHPHGASSPCLVGGKVTHWGFLLGGRGRIVGGRCSLCAESLDKKHVYRRVASKPPQRAKSLSPCPLCSGKQAFGFRQEPWMDFLLLSACCQPLSLLFDEVTLANHRFLLACRLGDGHVGWACGMLSGVIWTLEVSEVVTWVKSVSSSSPFPQSFPRSYLCTWPWYPELPVNWNCEAMKIETGERRGQWGVYCSSGTQGYNSPQFLVLVFPPLAFLHQRR